MTQHFLLHKIFLTLWANQAKSSLWLQCLPSISLAILFLLQLRTRKTWRDVASYLVFGNFRPCVFNAFRPLLRSLRFCKHRPERRANGTEREERFERTGRRNWSWLHTKEVLDPIPMLELRLLATIEACRISNWSESRDQDKCDIIEMSRTSRLSFGYNSVTKAGRANLRPDLDSSFQVHDSLSLYVIFWDAFGIKNRLKLSGRICSSWHFVVNVTPRCVRKTFRFFLHLPMSSWFEISGLVCFQNKLFKRLIYIYRA